jgi:hypothetical protein
MKNSILVLIIILSGMVFSYKSCTNDPVDIPEGETPNFDSITNSFTKGYLQYYGIYSGFHNHDLTLTSDSINWENGTGFGSFLNFEIFTNSNTFEIGTYTFNKTIEAGTFDYAHLAINTDLATVNTDYFYLASSGIITITKSGSNYEIDYNLSMQKHDSDFYPLNDFAEISGSYLGPITTLQSQKSNKFR